MHYPAAKVAARLLAVALASAAATVARADDVDQAIDRLVAVDQRVHIMALEFNEAPREQGDTPVRRLVDAQGLMGLGHTDEATTLLLDVALRWPATPAGRDAAFLLADSLFRLGDLRLARRYYEEALSKFSGTKRERHALIRLVDIALSTRELGHVDRYLDMLAKTQGGTLDPAVRYLEAKILYQRGDLDEAGRRFVAIAGSVPPASVYAWRARYFAATVLVKKGELDGALRTFDALLGDAPADATARDVQDLARLAVGRIRYRQGVYDRAAASYRLIAEDSKWWPDALYELGWTHVAAKRFDDAQAAFGRLRRAQPDGPRAPELALLLANIDLRQGRLAEARTQFTSTRDELEPTYDKLREVIVRSQADPGLLDSLTNRSHDEIDVAAFVPESARRWVRSDPEVQRLLKLANDVAVSQRAFADAGDIIERVETVLADAARVNPLELFVDLRRTRQISGLLFAELTATRDRFTDRARRLEAPRSSASSGFRRRWTSRPSRPPGHRRWAAIRATASASCARSCCVSKARGPTCVSGWPKRCAEPIRRWYPRRESAPSPTDCSGSPRRNARSRAESSGVSARPIGNASIASWTSRHALAR
jgi:TolA-binding protein